METARQQVESLGYRFRIVAEDGKWLTVTADYCPNRLNVEVIAGKVVSAYWPTVIRCGS